MKTIFYKYSLFALLSLVIVKNSFGQKKYLFSIPNSTSTETIKIDLPSLILNIGKYDNKWIETSGDVMAFFEMFAIMPREDMKFQGTGVPALWLKLDDKMKVNTDSLNGKSFIIRGRINKNSKGHLSQYQGTIQDIFYIKEI
jgi:hypothetical protein